MFTDFMLFYPVVGDSSFATFLARREHVNFQRKVYLLVYHMSAMKIDDIHKYRKAV